MKRALFLGVMMLLLSFPIGIIHAAEIYWDRTAADEEITDQDFQLKYGEPKDTKSLGDLEIYDNNLVINVPGPDEPAEPDYESGAPIPPPRAVAAPRSTDVAPPQPRIAPRSTETGRTLAPAVRRAPAQTPKPATQEIETQPRPSEQAVSDQPPATAEKKMKWGQVDVKPSEPKNRFRWGEKK